MTEQIRALALELLLATEEGAYSHVVLSEALDKYAYLPKRDRAFLTRLVEGTLEYRLQLDYSIDLYAKTPAAKQKPVIRTILRMGMYQLCFMDSVPAHAVCSESVKLAQKKGFGGLKGFVNGVLRAAARAQERTEGIPLPEGSSAAALSVRWSMPMWIVQLWLDAYGLETTEKMLAGSMREPPLSVRCQLTNASVDDCIALLKQQGVSVERHPYVPYALTLKEVDSLMGLAAFQKGFLTVQDVSSMLVAEAAAPKRDSVVIDVCAAPGGKTFHMADRVPEGIVFARDIGTRKTARMLEGVRRLGCTHVTVQERDACVLYEEDIASADIVLADVPCSGLGVLARKKELRYRLAETDIAALVRLQREILAVVWQYVKPGGSLIYSTCTVSRAENEEMIAWFCKTFPFEPETLVPCLPKPLQMEKSAENGYLQLLPGVHACDGFFVARLRRTGQEGPRFVEKPEQAPVQTEKRARMQRQEGYV